MRTRSLVTKQINTSLRKYEKEAAKYFALFGHSVAENNEAQLFVRQGASLAKSMIAYEKKRKKEAITVKRAVKFNFIL